MPVVIYLKELTFSLNSQAVNYDHMTFRYATLNIMFSFQIFSIEKCSCIYVRELFCLFTIETEAMLGKI